MQLMKGNKRLSVLITARLSLEFFYSLRSCVLKRCHLPEKDWDRKFRGRSVLVIFRQSWAFSALIDSTAEWNVSKQKISMNRRRQKGIRRLFWSQVVVYFLWVELISMNICSKKCHHIRNHVFSQKRSVVHFLR